MPIQFNQLENSDLIVDELYEGNVALRLGGDVISKVLKGVTLMGGFRFKGVARTLYVNYCGLHSSLVDLDWPDNIDLINGMFTYFGDNKSPGPILNTRGGNRILEKSFEYLHSDHREKIPPFFIFTKESGRDKRFRGLAVPGHPSISNFDDLVSIWSIKDNTRFQNYKAIFSILNVNKVSRLWLDNLLENPFSLEGAPDAYIDWVNNGKYDLLTAKQTKHYREKEEQLPTDSNDIRLLNKIHSYFSEKPTEFEKFSSKVIKLMDLNVTNIDVTRPWKDGGIDGIGEYSIGHNKNHSLNVDFAMEAKCFNPSTTSCTVRHTSRLISRLRYRQFGIFITTSYIAKQAYKEIIDDGHPVLVISGKDIIDIIKLKYAKTVDELESKLINEFPL